MPDTSLQHSRRSLPQISRAADRPASRSVGQPSAGKPAHVTFVTLGMEQLGVEYLSSYLKAHGHRTSLAHNPALFNDRFQLNIPVLAQMYDCDDDLVERILRLNPDVIGFSALTNTFGWCIELARRIRARRHIPTVFGGVHASAEPECVMGYDEVDFVCQGEGEVALLSLVEALQRGDSATGIPNIWTKSDGQITPPPSVARFLPDLNALPFPDKELYAPAIPRRYVYRMMTARGCPYRCTFCFNNFFAELPTEGNSRKEYLRRRSVDNCLQELAAGKRRFDFSMVEFHDDIFTMDKEWLQDFLPRFKEEIGVPWICETHARFMDDELAQLMKDTGCIGAKMGIQSLDGRQYKTQTLKRVETEEHIIATFNAFRKARLQLDVDHIFGLPGESPEAKEHAFSFYKQHSPGRIACFWLSYFPGIEITRKAHERGELSDAQMEDIRRGNMLWYHQAQALTPEAQAQLEFNRGYMAAFEMLPSMPKALRGLANPRYLRKLPGMLTLSRTVMATKMLADWLGDGNAGAIMYLRLYAHHMLGEGRRMNAPISTDPHPASAHAP